MIDTNVDLFTLLKRNRAFTKKQNVITAVYFQLDFDENGAFIKVIDENKKEIDPNYEFYGGNTRSVLKSLEAIKDKNSFRIDWVTPEDRIYISENEHLLWQLQHCDNFVDGDFNPIRFEEGLAKILVVVEDTKPLLQTKIVLSHQGKRFSSFSFLSENNVFAERSIFRIPPLSEKYKDIWAFETNLFPKDLEKYFSLLFSYFKNISVKYEDYIVVEGPPKKTLPTLIFEKVDSNNSLYLKVSTSLPGFDADFFDNYDVSKIVTINELEKKITVSDILHEDTFASYYEIDKMLKKYKKKLPDLVYQDMDNLFIIEEELAKEFIHQELPNLITRFVILGAEKLKTYKVRASTPKLNLNLSHGINFLEGDASLDIEGQTISLFDALNQYSKQSYIILNDGTHAIVNQDYMNKLARIFKKQKDKVKISFFDLPIVEEIIDKKVSQETFKQAREIYLGFNDIQNSKVKIPKLEVSLRPYQEQGFKWLSYLHKHQLGGCLADDMGLGKTLQAISLLASVYPKEKMCSLIIMPRSLLFNWENEIKKFKPQLTFYTYHGNNRDLEAARKHNLILTTYAMVRNDIELLKNENFYFIILDESQNIKNMNSQISKAVMLLNGKHRFALSGTPIENNLGELYALFRFLNPSMFGTIEEFNRNYVGPIQKNNDKEALLELKKKIYPFILRRLKRDVLKELPEKIEQVLYVDMTPEQKAFYEQRRQFYYDMIKSQIAQNGITKSQFFILQALSELRQIASIPESKSDNGILSPKREVLMENIMDIIANNHKVLVFANFLHILDCVSEDLESAGIEYLVMTGATRDRKNLVERFQEDDQCKVFLMTLKTGGLGLNLTAADYIFIFDPWWNRSAENQAIDRSHRIGQDKTVFSYKLITRGTIEEKILELQKIKSELFDNLITSDGASIKSLDEKDVEFVLGE